MQRKHQQLQQCAQRNFKNNRGETLFGKLFPPAMFWFSLISVVYPSSFVQVLTLAFLHDTHEAPIRASKL